MHITTFKYNCTALSHSTHSKPHHTSYIAFQPSFRITPPCQTIQHHLFRNHISYLASQHTTIFPMYHSIIPHRITTFHIWHCTWHHTISYIFYTALYFHITATLGWIRHNIPHLALQNIPHHQIPHHTIPHHAMRCMIWWFWNSDVVWCAVRKCG